VAGQQQQQQEQQEQQEQQQQRYFDPYEPLDMHDKGTMPPRPIKVVKPKGRRGKRTAVAMAAVPGGRLARAVDQLNNRCGAWGALLVALPQEQNPSSQPR
jgi:hypothetical protein